MIAAVRSHINTDELRDPLGGVEPVLIEAVEGPAAGARARRSAGSLTIGAAHPCELRLADPSVSRRHLQVELLPGGVGVLDLGSRNGTFYLDARIERARVPVGAC